MRRLAAVAVTAAVCSTAACTDEPAPRFVPPQSGSASATPTPRPSGGRETDTTRTCATLAGVNTRHAARAAQVRAVDARRALVAERWERDLRNLAARTGDAALAADIARYAREVRAVGRPQARAHSIDTVLARATRGVSDRCR
ncbi:MAG TPA: hypothetical protein VFY17_10825 [Pilimelia sp.]|nr:hypothetical protein [Pilimelia sp.]